ncbi:frequency clock protein [Xylariales sp. PMI_506]|nr:frequency clock protein [Xylariales sp. PMI_506]
MGDSKNKSAGPEPPPQVTYKNPRRTSPENSITLRHHRMAREASRRNSPALHKNSVTSSPRRHSSDESNETGLSDPKRWFDRSNENPNAILDSMDVDPPFFQKETDSSNDDGQNVIPTQSPAYNYVQSRGQAMLRPGITHSSSADDFRSVIDDLTIENKRLREELKRYRQMGPDSLRQDKLFEVKVHGLPSRKKRELEAALRDFTTSLDDSSTGVSSARRKDKGKPSKGVDSGMSKHPSSSSGSQSRPNPTDSAYASMSTGPGSSDPSLPGKMARHRSNQTLERYLQDIPEGLWPRASILPEKDKKKLVVRRLEQLFTGKGFRQARPLQPPPAINEDVEMTTPVPLDEKSVPSMTEAAREAQILPRSHHKESHSRGGASASNSGGDQTDFRDNGNGSGSGSGSGHKESETSPPNPLLPEQRPTRPGDLDPDRIQVPSENMDYIRHLGLTAPQSQKHYSAKDVSPDAEGWVYLNLLCNLAQLHMFNVTPAFIRSAVTEKSRQFQLSPDGRKIRWRGGSEGTKFSSDSSGSNSQRGNSSEDTDGSNENDQRKKQKTRAPGDEGVVSEPSKFGPQVSNSSHGFHYKPLFTHHQTSSSDDQPSVGDESGSSYGPPEESNLGMTSKWNQSGVSGVSQRKRRRDGAIIYYTGAPFCTDLSGDFGEISTDSSNMTSLEKSTPAMRGPEFKRTASGSSIPFKPLSNLVSHRAMMDLDFAPPELTPENSDVSDDIDADFPWSNLTQSVNYLIRLEASGVGGIAPEDHFIIAVSTRRPKTAAGDHVAPPKLMKHHSHETAESRDTTESVIGRLATMSTSSPHPLQSPGKQFEHNIEIEYISAKVKRLLPAPLPPPTFYFVSSEEDTLSDTEEVGYDSDVEAVASRSFLRRAVSGPLSANEELSSNDEEDEHSDDGAEADDSGSMSPDNPGELADDVGELGFRPGPAGRVSDLSKMTTGSSVATAGGAASGYSSTGEA